MPKKDADPELKANEALIDPAPEPDELAGVEQPGEEKPPEDKDKAPDPREREIRHLRRQAKKQDARLRELEEASEYWKGRRDAGGEGERGPAKEAEPEQGPEDELDLVDIVTNQGVKGLEKVLSKLGYVKASDVESKIGKTREEITRDAALLGRFPGLGQEDSDFYRATGKRYQQLSKNKGIKDSGMLLELAAELAEKDVEMQKAGEERRAGRRTRETPEHLDDDDFDEKFSDDDDEEAERIERVRSQAGERGRRTSREDTAADALTPLQRRLAAKFGVSEEAYRKRARSGVQMSGLSRR